MTGKAEAFPAWTTIERVIVGALVETSYQCIVTKAATPWPLDFANGGNTLTDCFIWLNNRITKFNGYRSSQERTNSGKNTDG